MSKYTLSQKLEAFKRLMKDEKFRDYNNRYMDLTNIPAGMRDITANVVMATEIDKEKENYIIETYPELFG